MNTVEISELHEVIAKLRHPQTGCPWDLEQTHQSLLKYLVEESYEYIDAVEKNDFNAMEEEIGDVLLQVLLHCQMASEEGHFNFESVSKKLKEKMIRRHPHVFNRDENKNLSSKEVIQNWQKTKEQEKGSKKINPNIVNLPSLLAVEKIGKYAHQVGFDWSNHHEVIEKVEEEWLEVKEELPPGSHFNKARAKEEIGDLLFSLGQLSRHLGFSAEECLREANQKFVKRFQVMENLMEQDQIEITSLKLKEMESYWSQVKKNEKKA